MPAGAGRDTAINSFFTTLEAAGQVPYAQDNQTAFLYRSNTATSVAFPGDHTGWSASASSATATRLGTTDIWIKELTFPTDARVDYKVVTNGNNWILDPRNPLQMWGGFGPNNELRMPDYTFAQETVRHPGVPMGNLTPNIITASTNLGYNVQYRVYTPAGYDAAAMSNLPVVYITDGHEFAADHLGSVVVTLDNLIASHELNPTIAVFIDPRGPGTGFNRRETEYTGNPDYADFVADELVTAIDAAYRTNPSPAGRTILGDSLGGGNSAYFGLTRSDTFENIAVLSPSTVLGLSGVYNAFSTAGLQNDLNFFLTYGTIGDGNGGPNLFNILSNNGYNVTRTTANEGHSWGNWRAPDQDILTGLIGSTADGRSQRRRFRRRRDLNVVLGNWNAGTPPNTGLAIPEPASVTCAHCSRSPSATAACGLARLNPSGTPSPSPAYRTPAAGRGDAFEVLVCDRRTS
ncbi:MAG: alpha/beta hydrolase-fold protein [Phycisphaerales bacterium]